MLYGPSLGGGFVLDDHRVLRLLREDRGPLTESLGLYRFLDGGEGNRRERAEGWYPWWLGDDVRYQHMRPLAECVIRVEYRLLGESALGYRIVGLLLYMLGVRLVLALFRMLSGDEHVSRWGALIFAVAVSHVVPVVFLSAQGDLLSLVLTCGTALVVGRYVRDGAFGLLLLSAAFYAAGLGVKEATLPVVVAPVCLAIVFRGRSGVVGRGVLSAALLLAIAGAWLTAYVGGGYGSNSSPMLDPFGSPGDYLLALPWRTLLLLSTWLISVNPFLLLASPRWHVGVYGLAAVGGVGLMMVARMFWRHHRGNRGVQAMALWVLPFLPLLACTVPDDRVMMLPRIGLTFLAAVWMTRPRADRSRRLRTVPLLLFVWFQVPSVVVANGILRHMERDSANLMRAAAGSDRAPRPGDCIFFLNAGRSHHVLFAQDCYRHITGSRETRVGFLSDIPSPRVSVVDEFTLRLEATSEPLLSSFLGMMGRSRERPKREGEVFSAGPLRGRIVRCRGDDVMAVELRFDEPLSSDSYRFYWYSPDGSLSRRFHGSVEDD